MRVAAWSFLRVRVNQSLHCFFFFNDTATTEIYTLSLHDALPISELSNPCIKGGRRAKQAAQGRLAQLVRASRLHREGRQFESVAAYQPSPCGLRLGRPAFAAGVPHMFRARGEGCRAEARRAKADCPGAEPKPHASLLFFSLVGLAW